MLNLPRKNNQKGQALLLVLLSMSVVLTVVLSIVSRSILDVAVTTGEEEALRAFSAAEAGVERALIIGSDIGKTNIGDAEFTTGVSGFASGVGEFVHPVNIFSGESLTAWFVDHDTDGNLECSPSKPCFTGRTIKICWGKEGSSFSDAITPAMEVSVVYAETPGVYGTIKIARAVFDPNTARRGSNNFGSTDAGSCTISGRTFPFQKTIYLDPIPPLGLGISTAVLDAQNGLQYAKLTMYYNSAESHPVGVDVNFDGNSPLPSQGVKIESLGTSGSSNRKIEVFQSYGETPPIFESVLFSPSGVVK